MFLLKATHSLKNFSENSFLLVAVPVSYDFDLHLTNLWQEMKSKTFPKSKSEWILHLVLYYYILNEQFVLLLRSPCKVPYYWVWGRLIVWRWFVSTARNSYIIGKYWNFLPTALLSSLICARYENGAHKIEISIKSYSRTTANSEYLKLLCVLLSEQLSRGLSFKCTLGVQQYT